MEELLKIGGILGFVLLISGIIQAFISVLKKAFSSELSKDEKEQREVLIKLREFEKLVYVTDSKEGLELAYASFVRYYNTIERISWENSEIYHHIKGVLFGKYMVRANATISGVINKKDYE